MALNSGAWWPLKKTMGAWRRSATEATAGSTTCQVSRFFQSRETTATRLRTSSGSLFQSPRGPWRSLLTRTGARPLARNKSAKLVATVLSALDQRTLPEARELVLLVDQLFGPHAIPVVLAEEPQAAQPAGTFQAVKIVELPLLAVAVVLAHLEVIGHPVDAALEAGTDSPLAAVLIGLSLEELLSLEPLQPGDDQARDARAGHAGRGGGGIGRVGPAAVVLLAALPVGFAPGPRPRA